ncbi:MAG: glycine cleavage system aminomethyltransferase GcvT, partial [Halanaerobiales bacterium]
GIIDDYLVYKTANNKYLLVVNAANTEKDFKWINEKSPEDVSVRNLSFEYALLALQGPKSIKVISSLTDIELTELAGYHFIEGKLAGVDVLLSRTGYTGEDGFEIYFDISKAEHLWQQIFEAGKELGLKPVGLGARNTLRLEKALCLHGNDIDESTDPLQAGLSFVVDLDKKDFIGKQSLEKIKKEGIKEKLAGFEMMERGIPRHGYKIKYNNKIIGEVTSGSYSPSLNKNIGLGYIENEFNEPGTKISIDIRGKSVNAKIVETPFI